ncbi:hypothetical protein [Defluviimonas salinarum]|uniref:Uncharacterized protein n=1 Tax=Defluviimonas salinarum TaxID=2992147 RepID=A0ABT3J7B7_9RHOB|nr:hypothetical protein [Defluviimonas salinarum]MCW3783588.1 hypothetical protein [Defluviimonas salinarum]
MTPQDAATALDGNQYREEGSCELFREMRAAGLVAVFGASDDLVELRGAIDDELGRGPVLLGPEGLIINRCDDDRCPHFRETAKSAVTIRPVFHSRGSADGCWTYETDLPVATYRILEDDVPYCRGIVFAMADLKARFQPEPRPSGETKAPGALRLVSARDRDIGAMLLLNGRPVARCDYDAHGSAGPEILSETAKNLSAILGLPLVEEELDDDEFLEMRDALDD